MFQRFFILNIYETNFRETLLLIWMQNKRKLYQAPKLIYAALIGLFQKQNNNSYITFGLF